MPRAEFEMRGWSHWGSCLGSARVGQRKKWHGGEHKRWDGGDYKSVKGGGWPAQIRFALCGQCLGLCWVVRESLRSPQYANWLKTGFALCEGLQLQEHREASTALGSSCSLCASPPAPCPRSPAEGGHRGSYDLCSSFLTPCPHPQHREAIGRGLT